MRIRVWVIATLWAAILVLSLPVATLSQAPPIVDFIQDVRGPVYLKKGEQKVKLDPKRDRRRALHAGETIWIDRGGYLLLTLCSDPTQKDCKPKEITSAGEFRVPSTVPPQTEAERKHQEAAQEMGRTGGRVMGVLSPFFSPAPSAVIRPATLVLRWVPSNAMSSFSVVIEDLNHKRLWERKIANGSTGSLDSSEVKEILGKYRQGHEKAFLILEVEDKNRIGSQSRFSVLSVRDEESLDRELAEWDHEPDALLRHLGRAHSFYIRNMFTEVADEFEAALSETPDSRDLLVRTIQAHRDTGNIAREENLKRRLNRQ